MSQPLWQKPGVQIDARIMRFLAGDDVVLDRELLPHDIRATRAHVEGLARIGVMTDVESADVGRVLDALLADVEAGSFVLDDRFEDGHSAIEHVVTERLGDVGRKIHTGRSRNDQVLVATRLYLRARLGEIGRLLSEIAQVLLDRAEREAGVPMPGYTHLQRAVVSSVGMWCAGYAESFLDDLELVHGIARLVDANPLGTAAGYGVNLPLDRAYTTRALGFARMQINPIAAQLSRGKYEVAVLGALGAALGDVRRLAWDLSLFTTSELGFVGLPPEYTTGSSLMPNKKNPDVVELLRASGAVVTGAHVELVSLLSLPSGYQRDLQYTKGPLVRALRHGIDALALLPDLLARMTFDEARMRALVDAGMYATDIAIESAARGVPFRTAYVQAAGVGGDATTRTPEASLAARVSPGAAADLMLPALRARLAASLLPSRPADGA